MVLKMVFMKGKYKIIIGIITICIVVAGTFFLLENNGVRIGSDSKGYVTKVVYASPGQHQVKIAVITGMHPRELHATDLVPQVVKQFALQNNVEIINYQVNVTDDPQDFSIGRSNGQALVAQYVIPDIKKSNDELVIICHDHKKGYGNGYYIATPTHDDKSVALGQTVHQLLPQFNYYPGSTDSRESTSINQVDEPLTQAGFPVFVYEIPEWVGNDEANNMTYELLNASLNALTGK